MTISHELFHEVADLGRQLRAAIPGVYAGYIPAMISFTSGAGVVVADCDGAGWSGSLRCACPR